MRLWMKILLCLLYALLDLAELRSLQPPLIVDIYWNRSNTIFQTSNNDHVLELSIKDRIIFHCPYTGTNSNIPHEYYSIYRVRRADYESCSLPTFAEGELQALHIHFIVNCSQPNAQHSFTALIDQFIGLPSNYGGVSYQPGETYYFISLSSMESRQTSCKHNNMKLKLHVLNMNETDRTFPGQRQTTRIHNIPPTSVMSTLSNSGATNSMWNNGKFSPQAIIDAKATSGVNNSHKALSSLLVFTLVTNALFRFMILGS